VSEENRRKAGVKWKYMFLPNISELIPEFTALNPRK
jgi:hypothetical protein